MIIIVWNVMELAAAITRDVLMRELEKKIITPPDPVEECLHLELFYVRLQVLLVVHFSL